MTGPGPRGSLLTCDIVSKQPLDAVPQFDASSHTLIEEARSGSGLSSSRAAKKSFSTFGVAWCIGQAPVAALSPLQGICERRGPKVISGAVGLPVFSPAAFGQLNSQ